MPQFCTTGGFGPPSRVTETSSWPCVDHPVSGLQHTTGRAVHTRFRFGSVPEELNLAAHRNSPVHYAKGTRSHISGADKSASGSARMNPPEDRFPDIVLPQLVSVRFQVHCPPLAGVLTIFRSRYFFTIGRQVVFSLTGWSPWIRTGFHGSGVTRDTVRRTFGFAYRAITFSGRPYPGPSATDRLCNSVWTVPQPRPL